jgi:hypothetical protein
VASTEILTNVAKTFVIHNNRWFRYSHEVGLGGNSYPMTAGLVSLALRILLECPKVPLTRPSMETL